MFLSHGFRLQIYNEIIPLSRVFKNFYFLDCQINARIVLTNRDWIVNFWRAISRKIGRAGAFSSLPASFTGFRLAPARRFFRHCLRLVMVWLFPFGGKSHASTRKGTQATVRASSVSRGRAGQTESGTRKGRQKTKKRRLWWFVAVSWAFVRSKSQVAVYLCIVRCKFPRFWCTLKLTVNS